jgi:hypothetical protein
MTLSELVVEQAPHLNPVHIAHYPLADIFTIGYRGNLIGYYDPQHHNLTLDGVMVESLVGV